MLIRRVGAPTPTETGEYRVWLTAQPSETYRHRFQKLAQAKRRASDLSGQEQRDRDVRRVPLRVGDRLVDETGEWEVASQPYVTNAGKDAYVRVKKVSQPEVTEIRSWGAHERVVVKRLEQEPPEPIGRPA
jgi:hypothetical protein